MPNAQVEIHAPHLMHLSLEPHTNCRPWRGTAGGALPRPIGAEPVVGPQKKGSRLHGGAATWGKFDRQSEIKTKVQKRKSTVVRKNNASGAQS